jgi:signal transduction histidine kinase
MYTYPSASGILLLLTFLLNNIVNAQANYNIKNYTGDNGLPQNSIKSISQDSDGYIWLATEDGLVRFDGHNFYTFNRSNLDIKDNRVNFVEGLERGSSHSATGKNKSIAVYFVSGDFVKIQMGTVSRDSARRNQYKEKIKKVVKDPKQFLETQGIPSPYTFDGQFQDFRIKAGNENGTFYLCGNKSIRFYRNYLKQYETSFPAPDVFNFFSISDKLCYFDPRTKLISIIGPEGYRTSLLSGDITSDKNYINFKSDVALYWNNISDQAFIYIRKSLYFLQHQPDGSLKTRKIVSNFDLAENNIKRVHYEPLSNRVFLGSITNGLFVITPHQFHTLTSNISKSQNIFYGHIPYSANTLLTADGHEIGLDPSTGKFTDHLLPTIREQNYFDQRVIVRDKNGTIWIKAGRKLVHLNRTGTKVLHHWMFEKHVRSIHQTKDGTVYTGLTNGEFYKVNIQNSIIQPILLGTCPAPREITQINSIGNDTLLIGTNSGMFLFRMSLKSLHLINSLKNISIKSIHPSNNNKIWVTALEKGLVLLNAKLQAISYPLDPKNFLASPHCVFLDSLGYLWIPTNKGLFQFSEKDLLAYEKLKNQKNQPSAPSPFYLYHTMEEGFETNEFNGSCQSCAAQLHNGYVSLPSLKGLVWFKPGNIYQPGNEKAIVLDRVNIRQEALPVKGDTLYLPQDPENISLHFSTVNTGNRYNQKLSYALIKNSLFKKPPIWIPIDNEDFTIRYSSLPSGKYTLIVRKLNGFGPDNYSYKRISIVIPPVWYETWWAWVCFLAAAMLSIYQFVRYRTRLIQKENQRLELLITERTSALRITMLELQQSKNEITDQVHILSKLLASIAHDVQSPLQYITYASAEIDEMVQLGELQKVSRLGLMISDVSSRMSTMLAELLNYVKVHVFGNKMQYKELGLAELVDSKIGIFKSVVESNHSQIDNEVPADLIVFSEHQLLSVIVHNLIDNAAKYTRNGKIVIYSQKHADETTELIISNTGPGLSQDMITFINSDRKQEDDRSTGKKSSGIGLFIVKEIAEMIGVKIRISQSDKTYFHLFFDQ